jgi:hypothetical protein
MNCSLNLCVKWSHAALTMLLTGSRPINQIVMSLTHQLTCGPFIKVSIKAICCKGDSNLDTPLLATIYKRKSFMKALALSHSSLNVLGRFPLL